MLRVSFSSFYVKMTIKSKLGKSALIIEEILNLIRASGFSLDEEKSN